MHFAPNGIQNDKFKGNIYIYLLKCRGISDAFLLFWGNFYCFRAFLFFWGHFIVLRNFYCFEGFFLLFEGFFIVLRAFLLLRGLFIALRDLDILFWGLFIVANTITVYPRAQHECEEILWVQFCCCMGKTIVLQVIRVPLLYRLEP